MVIKWILIVIFIVHGLIHILGGFSELKIAQFNNLSGATLIPLSNIARKILAVIWLVVTLLLIAAAVGLSISQIWWRPVALFAAALSQILIVLWWPDAKWGSVMNILIIAGVFLYP